MGQLESEVAALQEAMEASKKETERQRNRADKLIRLQKQQQINAANGGSSSNNMAGQGSPGFGGDSQATIDRLLAENAALRSDLSDKNNRTSKYGSNASPPSASPEVRRGSSTMGANNRDNNLDRARVAERSVKKLQDKVSDQVSFVPFILSNVSCIITFFYNIHILL